jgi:surface antigen
MKSTIIKSVILAASACLAVGCSPYNTQNQNTGIGAVGGAVVGGLAGAAVGTGAAVGVGIVGGALIGGLIGHSMDHSDYYQANYAMTNMPKHTAHHWRGKNGTMYTVIPTSKAMAMYGHSHCRKFTMTATMKNGKKERMHGVACRKANGMWETVK